MTRLPKAFLAILLFVAPPVLSAQGWAPFLPNHEIDEVLHIAADEAGRLWLYSVGGELYSLAPGEDRVDIAGEPGGTIISLRARTDHLLAIIMRASGVSLERSLDGGASWSPVELTLPSGQPASPRRILIDSDGRRYIGCSFGHLLQEVPGTQGAEWRFYTQKPYLNNDSLLEVFSIAGSDGSLVISLVDQSLGNGGVVNDILVEGPRGEWRSVSPTDNVLADWSVVRTSEGKLLVATTVGGLYPSLSPVYITSDTGRSWDTLEVGAVVQAPARRIPMAASRSGSLAYLTDGGVHYSNDGGRTFRKIEANGYGYVALGADDRLRAHLFIGVRGDYELYEEDVDRTTMVKRLEDPVLIREGLLTTDGHIRQIMDHPRSDGLRWYALADRKTIYEWTAGRQGWLPLKPPSGLDSIAMIVSSEDELYVGGPDGLFRRDEGVADGWVSLFSYPVSRAIVGAGEIVLNDSGSGWLTYHFLTDGTVVSPPAESPAADPDVRLIGQIPDGRIVIISERGVSLLPLLSDRWRTVPLPIPSDEVDHVDVRNDSVVICSDSSDLWVTNDAGTTWNRSTLDDGPVIDITHGYGRRYDNNRYMSYIRFVALTRTGIWNSDDSGKSWTSIVDNLPTSDGLAAFTFATGGPLSLLAIDDHGIWVAAGRFLSSVESKGSAASTGPQVRLRDRVLRLTVPGDDLTIKVFDIQGREIRSTVETTSDAGVTHGAWQVPSGIRGTMLLRVRSSDGEWVVKVVL